MRVTDYSANLLRRSVQIVRESGQVPDGAGGYTNTWAPVWSGYVDLGPLSGRESVFAQQLQSVIGGRAVMRYTPTPILAAHVIQYRDRLLNVEAVVNVEEADRWLVLFYSTGVAV